MFIDFIVIVVERVASAKMPTMIRRLFIDITCVNSLINDSINLNITIPFHSYVRSVYDLNIILKFLLAICAINF